MTTDKDRIARLEQRVAELEAQITALQADMRSARQEIERNSVVALRRAALEGSTRANLRDAARMYEVMRQFYPDTNLKAFAEQWNLNYDSLRRALWKLRQEQKEVGSV